MSGIKQKYKLPLIKWSATDYAYLQNENLGWASDDQKWYVFDTEDNMRKFQEYLTA
jgi:hypothetical protein